MTSAGSPERVRRILPYAALAVVLVLAALVLARDWDRVSRGIREMSVASVVGSFVTGLAAILCSVPSWRALLADLGTHLPLRPATGVFLAGQLGKFVPGSVWVVVAQAQLAARHGVSRVRSATVGLLAMGVSLASAVIVGSAFLPLGSARARHSYGWVALLAVAALVALAPPVLTPVVQRLLRLLRRAPLERPLSWSGICAAVGWATAGWLLYGVHLWLLVRAVPGHHGDGLLPRSVGAFALAWAVGFVIVFLPAGGGAREAALIVLLDPMLPSGGPAAVAVVSRVLLTVGDLSVGLPALLLARRVGHPVSAPAGPAQASPQL